MKKKSRLSILSVAASLDMTVLLLLTMSILVVWGTLYQVDNGIYAAQERFFRAWFIRIAGIVPFPAVKTITALLSINLLAQLFKKRRISLSTIGFFIIHIGVAVLVVSAALTGGLVREAAITLNKGQSAKTAYDFSVWQLTITVNHRGTSSTTTYPIARLRKGEKITLAAAGAQVSINELYDNCRAMLDPADRATIIALRKEVLSKERGQSTPGATFTLSSTVPGAAADSITDYVYAGFDPVVFNLNGATIALSIFPQTLTLPLKIQLTDFEVTWHPGTTKAKSYRSTLRVLGKNIEREVVVEMNRPFRNGAYTFYQMGYSGSEGSYSTTLAVVRNPLRYMPYIASLIVVIGLLLHFLVKMVFTLTADKGSSRDKK